MMTALGQQRRLNYVRTRSAYPPKAARQRTCEHFAFGPKSGHEFGGAVPCLVWHLRLSPSGGVGFENARYVPDRDAVSGDRKCRIERKRPVRGGLRVRFA